MGPGHGQVDGRMEEFSNDAGPSVCVLGRSSLSLDFQSFIYTVRGWSEVFLILTFQKPRTHVIKHGDTERRKEEWTLLGQGDFWAVTQSWLYWVKKMFRSLLFKLLFLSWYSLVGLCTQLTVSRITMVKHGFGYRWTSVWVLILSYYVKPYVNYSS